MISAIIFAFLAVSARAEITCDDCLDFGGSFQTYLMSADSVAEQTELLAAMLCPAAEDAALCEEYVRGYWSEITAAMYPKFLDPKDVCKRLGACTKDIRTFLATPTCDECRGSITRVAEVISSPEQDAEIVAFLQSDWCPGTEDVETCKQGVADLIPSAMPILGEVLVERNAEYCCKLSSDGVCC